MHALATLMSFVAAESEKSKTPFYVAGGALAVWAVLVSAIGIAKHETFPGTKGTRGVVLAISTVLVLAAMAAAVATS